MSLPSAIRTGVVAAALMASGSAVAGDFQAPHLPSSLSARHVEKPFPDGGGLSYKRNGPNPWTLTAVGLLAGSAVTTGLAVSQNKRMREAPDQASLDKAFSTQKTMAWTTAGLLGGAAVSFTFSKVF